VLAGVARICITPPVGTWQGGYGARNKPAEGVHDDLFARALVLEDEGTKLRCAIVSVDAVSLPHEMANSARREAETLSGIPAARIALCCSHTHGGPLTRPMAGLGDAAIPDEAYVRIFDKLIAGAVAAASRQLEPVSVRIGHSEAGFNVNRRVPSPEGTVMRPNREGAVDRDVAVIRLDRLDPSGNAVTAGGAAGIPGTMAPAAAPLAILFRYTCHATSLGADNYLYTADYPGAAAAFIEGAYGGATSALFLQGCTGNIRPHYIGPSGGFRSATWDELARAGRELGGAVISAAERATIRAAASGEASLTFAGETTLLPYAPAPDEAELERTFAAGRWPDGAPVNQADKHWAAQIREMVGAGTLPKGTDAEVQVIRLGSIWLVLFPGEVFVEIGWNARDAVAAITGAPKEDVVVAAYSNGNVHYVPTGKAIPEGGYESTVFRRMGNTGFTAEAEEILVRSAASLASGLR
jgi:neutral ceramidase